MQSSQTAPTFTPKRILTLILIGPVAVVVMALLIQAGPNAWVLHESWTSDGAVVLARDHTGRMWCNEVAAAQPSAALEQIAERIRSTAEYRARCGR